MVNRQHHLNPSKPFDTGWYLFFTYLIRFIDELSAGCIMIISTLFHQIKNFLLVNRSIIWHGLLIFGMILIWFLAGWLLDCDLCGLASDSIEVVSRILPTVPYTEPSPSGPFKRASFFNRKRYSYHLVMRNWK